MQCGRNVSMFWMNVLPPFSLWVFFKIDLTLIINYIIFVTSGKCSVFLKLQRPIIIKEKEH